MLAVLGLAVVGGGIFLFMRRGQGGLGWVSTRRNVFGDGYGPPTGADINQRPGPPASPIASSTGRQLQQIKTGADAVVGLAKDLKTGYDTIKSFFN
jgi:hypothetical protein